MNQESENLVQSGHRRAIVRKSARKWRDAEADLLAQMAQLLPVPKEDQETLTKATILRLSSLYIYTKQLEESQCSPGAWETVETFVDVMDGFLLTLDNNGLILRTSSPVYRILSYHAHEMMGMNILDFLHPEDQKGFLKKIRDSYFKGKQDGNQSKNGVIDHVARFKYRILTSDNKTKNIGYIAMQLRGHVKTTRAGRGKANPWLLVVACYPLCVVPIIELRTFTTSFILKFDKQHRPLFVPDEFSEFLGWDGKMALKKKHIEFVEDHRPFVESSIELFRSHGTGDWVNRVVLRNGDMFFRMLTRYFIVAGSNGKEQYSVGIYFLLETGKMKYTGRWPRNKQYRVWLEYFEVPGGVRLYPEETKPDGNGIEEGGKIHQKSQAISCQNQKSSLSSSPRTSSTSSSLDSVFNEESPVSENIRCDSKHAESPHEGIVNPVHKDNQGDGCDNQDGQTLTQVHQVRPGVSLHPPDQHHQQLHHAAVKIDEQLTVETRPGSEDKQLVKHGIPGISSQDQVHFQDMCILNPKEQELTQGNHPGKLHDQRQDWEFGNNSLKLPGNHDCHVKELHGTTWDSVITQGCVGLPGGNQSGHKTKKFRNHTYHTFDSDTMHSVNAFDSWTDKKLPVGHFRSVFHGFVSDDGTVTCNPAKCTELELMDTDAKDSGNCGSPWTTMIHKGTAQRDSYWWTPGADSSISSNYSSPLSVDDASSGSVYCDNKAHYSPDEISQSPQNVSPCILSQYHKDLQDVFDPDPSNRIMDVGDMYKVSQNQASDARNQSQHKILDVCHGGMDTLLDFNTLNDCERTGEKERALPEDLMDFIITSEFDNPPANDTSAPPQNVCNSIAWGT